MYLHYHVATVVGPNVVRRSQRDKGRVVILDQGNNLREVHMVKTHGRKRTVLRLCGPFDLTVAGRLPPFGFEVHGLSTTRLTVS